MGAESIQALAQLASQMQNLQQQGADVEAAGEEKRMKLFQN